MRRRLEDEWKASANDGASSPIGIELFRPRIEVEDLLHAWSRERGRCIEMGMALEQVRRFLAHLMNDSNQSPCDRKRARALLTVIGPLVQDLEPDSR